MNESKVTHCNQPIRRPSNYQYNTKPVNISYASPHMVIETRLVRSAIWNEILIEMENCNHDETLKKASKDSAFSGCMCILLCIFCDVVSGSFNHDCDRYLYVCFILYLIYNV